MLQRPSVNSTTGGLPFLFVHQPKNAGTSVRTALIDALLPSGAPAEAQGFGSGSPSADSELSQGQALWETAAEPRFRRKQLCIPKRLLCMRGSEPLAVIAGHMQYKLTTKVGEHDHASRFKASNFNAAWVNQQSCVRILMLESPGPEAPQRTVQLHHHSLHDIHSRPCQASSVLLLLVRLVACNAITLLSIST
jgi:hypothetical protein